MDSVGLGGYGYGYWGAWVTDEGVREEPGKETGRRTGGSGERGGEGYMKANKTPEMSTIYTNVDESRWGGMVEEKENKKEDLITLRKRRKIIRTDLWSIGACLFFLFFFYFVSFLRKRRHLHVCKDAHWSPSISRDPIQGIANSE